MGLRCAEHTPRGPNLAQPSAKMRTRWPNFGQYRPHQGSKKEKKRDREPNLKIQKSRIQRVCVGHGTFSSLSLLLCLLDSFSPFPFLSVSVSVFVLVSLSVSLSLFLSLSFTFFLSLAVSPSPLSVCGRLCFRRGICPLSLLSGCGGASLSHPRVRRGPGLRASRQHPSQEGG